MSTRTNSLDANKRFARRTPGSIQAPADEQPAAPTPARAPLKAAPAPEPTPAASTPAPATPYTVRIPSDIADAWRARVADAGVNQTDAVTAAFQAFMAMDVDEFATAVLANKRRRRQGA